MPAPVRERYFGIAGVRTLVREAGPAVDASAVVFVHGNPGSSRDWIELASSVGEFSRVVAIDMPGFGRTDKPRTFDYTVPGYSAFLGRALRVLGIQQTQLVLHDFGGAWGLHWAAANPNAVTSAVLIDTGVLIDYDWHYLARIWRTPVLGEAFQAAAIRPLFRLILRHGNKRRLPREFVDGMHADFDRGTRRAVLKLYRNTDPEELGALRRTFRDRDLRALVVWGKHDPYLPVEHAHRQLESFPSASVVVFEDSGHWPFIDNAEAAARRIVPFLRDGAVSA